MVAFDGANGIAGSNHGQAAWERDGLPPPTAANWIDAEVDVARRVAIAERDGPGLPAAAIVATGQRAEVWRNWWCG